MQERCQTFYLVKMNSFILLGVGTAGFFAQKKYQLQKSKAGTFLFYIVGLAFSDREHLLFWLYFVQSGAGYGR